MEVESSIEKSEAEIIEDIRLKLNEAKHGSLEHRKLVVRRIFKQWHPDKHQNEKDKILATKVFQQVQQIIEDIKFFETHAQCSPIVREAAQHASDFTSFCQTRSFPTRTNHSAQRQRDSSFWFFPTCGDRILNPQPVEGKRWMRQSEMDLKCAEVYLQSSFNEWTCFMAHQVRNALI